MRHFNYYLYDNYDVNQVECPEDDPRVVLNEQADSILTAILESEPGVAEYDSLCERFSKILVDKLIHIGLLRRENTVVFLDTPVFLEEDADYLEDCFSETVSCMVEKIVQSKKDFYELAEQLNNGFSSEVNLYHVLCGAILDGYFFECISNCDIVATSRVHESGLDYLIIAYEKSQRLEGFSQKLLCSYNRFTDGTRALQSFGDADGERVDVFRFSKQKQLGSVPRNLKNIETLWDSIGTGNIRQKLLEETQRFVETGDCEDKCYELLSAFGYIREGKIAVPVYRMKHQLTIEKLEQLTKICIFEEMKATLRSTKILSGLVCSQHGVSEKEIANELYHIVFGQINEWLVAEGFVAKPEHYETEGRYLKSIEIG